MTWNLTVCWCIVETLLKHAILTTFILIFIKICMKTCQQWTWTQRDKSLCLHVSPPTSRTVCVFRLHWSVSRTKGAWLASCRIHQNKMCGIFLHDPHASQMSTRISAVLRPQHVSTCSRFTLINIFQKCFLRGQILNSLWNEPIIIHDY